MHLSYELLLTVDRAGCVVRCDDPMGLLSGPQALQSKLPGRTIHELIPPGMIDLVAAAVAREEADARNPDAPLHLAKLRDVVRYEMSVSTTPGAMSGLTEVVLRCTEVAGKSSIEERLKLVETRQKFWGESFDDVIWTMAPDGSITYVSAAIEQMRGFTPAEAMKQSIEEIVTPVYQAEIMRYFADVREAIEAGLPPRAYRGDQEYKCKDGSTVWTEVHVYPLLDDAGKLVELIGVTRNIAERKRQELALGAALQAADSANKALERANAELREWTSTDAISGARSRRFLESQTNLEIAVAERYRTLLSLIVFDIDRFKLINDQLGHDAGDSVIAAVAEVARAHLQPNAVLARWGGDEFVVLLPGCPLPEASQIAERIRSDMERGHPLARARVTLSLGVAEWLSGESPRELFQRADAATYVAKAGGRNAISIG